MFHFLRSGIIPHFILAILIIFFLTRLKDKDKAGGLLFEAQKWNLFDVLIYILLLDVSYFLSYFLVNWMKGGYLLYVTLFWALNILFFFLIFKLKIRQSFSTLGLSPKGFLGNIFYGLKMQLIINLIFFGLLFLSSKPAQLLEMSRPAYGFWFHYQNNLYVIGFFIFLYVLIIPFTEELICRGLIYSPFRRKVGKWGAIFLSATIFALYHRQLFNANGLLFAYLYEKRRSLISSLVAHSILDLSHIISFIYLTDFFDLGYRIDSRGYVAIMFLIFITLLVFILILETGIDKR